jgi:hypothetical protein
MPADRESKPPSPWAEFLEDLDGLLRDQIHVHCLNLDPWRNVDAA